MSKSESKELANSQKDSYYFQIDFLKALMIFLVIFDHTIPWTIKNEIGVILWERISIPVFLVIMGFNFGISYQSKGEKKFYKNYLSRRVSRYLIPFFIIYILTTIIGIYFYGFDFQVMLSNQNSPYNLEHLFIGIIPFWGPGNWFLPVLFGSIIILPIIYKGFSRSISFAFLSLILCFLIEIGLHSLFYSQFKVKFYIDGAIDPVSFLNYAYTFLSITFTYISAFGLGMWIARNPKLFSWHNLIIWVLFIISLIYLIEYQFFDFVIKDAYGIRFLTGDYHFLAFPYSAFLVLVVIRFLPKNNKGMMKKFISVLGKATYHILLTQIVYFAILIAVYGNYECTSIFGVGTGDLECFLALFVNWAICIPIGIIWWSFENSIRVLIKKRKEN
ncbi:MAG: acyltransferase family protein [Candidatus Lokiarchaeota archaeon]|nr:acyltransferase family protein [Candidatus Lokiarchaeota archaeon]MBD3199209.1 acyltransferase family protein [Candidatus Lokiarchaeota archaeon]